VQANNALVLEGENAIGPFLVAFDDVWQHDFVGGFGKIDSVKWMDLVQGD